MSSLFPGTNRTLFYKKLLVSLVYLYLVNGTFSQEVRVNCTDEPLNKILITLRDNYKLMLSFDDMLLSTYKLTLNNKFASPVQAFDYLIKGLPLAYEISEGVYIFFTVQPEKITRNHIITGVVSDKTNHETLPFSAVLINKAGQISDARGNFSYTSATDSIFTIRISYLGYYVLDTVVTSGTHYNFRLTPSVVALEEIIVIGSEVARSIQTGSSPGISRLNHKIAYYLPGNGDNSIFNLLRLQPGILAAGEQSADFIIWGSYEGQSQVIFDGFTIYGMKNFNDNISAVNPYMAKDIKVMKGAYGAEYGERVGGIVDITGTDGNRLSPSAQFSINNMTLNAKVSVPFRKNSSLMLAYRQTFYDLYDPQEIATSAFGRGRGGNSTNVVNVFPDYGFRDANLKYSGGGRKSNYFISLYGGMDHFSYRYDFVRQRRDVSLDYRENNNQFGGSAFYGFNWKDKITTGLTVSYSSLLNDRENTEQADRSAGNGPDEIINVLNKTSINEINGRIDNKFTLSEKQNIETGAGLLYYHTVRQENSAQGTLSDENNDLHVPYLYVQDDITLFKKLTLRPGIRADYYMPPQRDIENPVGEVETNKMYIQPRISAMIRFSEHFRLNMAAGMYNQFVAKNLVIDTVTGNYKLNWSVCDGKLVSVLSSYGFTLGLSYNKNGYAASVEAYMKNTGGLTRYLETGITGMTYEGDGKSMGLDFFVKKEFKNQTFWVSYTLSKTLEFFPYFTADEYFPAMHDQRHELKLAGLAKIRSFHFSANYVFGSGFPDPAQLPEVVDYMQPYSRLDAAIIYRFSKRKIHLDAGISVLNILFKDNIKYANVTHIPADDSSIISLYTGAVPFTPAVFLNIYY